jgi:chromosome segregation ATPase
VKELIEGGPAAECGRINCGDRIVAVDGRRVTGLSLWTVSRLISGLPSTTVSIQALPASEGGEAEAYEVNLVRVGGGNSGQPKASPLSLLRKMTGGDDVVADRGGANFSSSVCSPVRSPIIPRLALEKLHAALTPTRLEEDADARDKARENVDRNQTAARGSETVQQSSSKTEIKQVEDPGEQQNGNRAPELGPGDLQQQLDASAAFLRLRLDAQEQESSLKRAASDVRDKETTSAALQGHLDSEREILRMMERESGVVARNLAKFQELEVELKKATVEANMKGKLACELNVSLEQLKADHTSTTAALDQKREDVIRLEQELAASQETLSELRSQESDALRAFCNSDNILQDKIKSLEDVLATCCEKIKSLEDMLADSQAIKEHRDALQDMWKEAKQKLREEKEKRFRLRGDISQIQQWHKEMVHLLVGTVEQALEEVKEAQEIAVRTWILFSTMRQGFTAGDERTETLAPRARERLEAPPAGCVLSEQLHSPIKNKIPEIHRTLFSQSPRAAAGNAQEQASIFLVQDENTKHNKHLSDLQPGTQVLLDRMLKQHQESFAEVSGDNERMKLQLSTMQAKYDEENALVKSHFSILQAQCEARQENVEALEKKLNEQYQDRQNEVNALQELLRRAKSDLKESEEKRSAAEQLKISAAADEAERAIQDLQIKYEQHVAQVRAQCDAAIQDVQDDYRSQLDGMRDMMEEIRRRSKQEREKEARVMQHHFDLARSSLQAENAKIKDNAVKKEEQRTQSLQRALERCQSNLADEELRLLQKKLSCSALEAMVARRDEEIEALQRQCALQRCAAEGTVHACSTCSARQTTCARLESTVQDLTRANGELRAALTRANLNLREEWKGLENGEHGATYSLI